MKKLLTVYLEIAKGIAKLYEKHLVLILKGLKEKVKLLLFDKDFFQIFDDVNDGENKFDLKENFDKDLCFAFLDQNNNILGEFGSIASEFRKKKILEQLNEDKNKDLEDAYKEVAEEINDDLLKEDKTLGDKMQIAEENYFDPNTQAEIDNSKSPSNDNSKLLNEEIDHSTLQSEESEIAFDTPQGDAVAVDFAQNDENIAQTFAQTDKKIQDLHKEDRVDFSVDFSIENFDFFEEKAEENGEKNNYFEDVFSLVEREERYEILEDKIPFSKFVKINFDQERFYVVGIIFEGNEPKTIVYGVPSSEKEFDEETKRIAEYVQFGEGFYFLYQDIKTGEMMKRK